MLGRKLAQRLIQDRRIGEQEITKLTLADITTPKGLPKFEGAYAEHAMDMGNPGSAETLIQQRPDFIFHLGYWLYTIAGTVVADVLVVVGVFFAEVGYNNFGTGVMVPMVVVPRYLLSRVKCLRKQFCVATSQGRARCEMPS